MIHHQLLPSEGILIVTPELPLNSNDFQQLAAEIDPYLDANGKLHGLMLDADEFPGWQDLAGLVAHFKFVRDHHRRIEKVAVVSDSQFLSVAPKFASHFVKAEIRHFSRSERDDAMRWLHADDPRA